MKFPLVYLKTKKQLTPDIIISGVVGYTGEIKVTGANGFDVVALGFEVPAGLPIIGIQKGGDPFKEIEY